MSATVIDTPPFFSAIVSHYRLVNALCMMDQDHPTLKYPYISDDYRNATIMVMQFLQEAYPILSEIHQEASAIIKLMQQVK